MRRKLLVGYLELLKPALADQPLIPVFQNYCFTGDVVYAYNDALGIVVPFKADRPFSCHGETLLGLLKNSRTEEVELEFDDDTVLVKAGRSKMRLPFLGMDDFLFEEPDDETWDVTLDLTDELMEAMAICLTTASSDNALPALMGLTINQGDGISIYSCDGDALSHYLIDGENYGESGDYTIPNEFCTSMLRIAKSDKSINGTLRISKDWALAELENGYKVYGRVIQNEDPTDYADLIEKQLRGEEPPYMAIPKNLELALSRALVVTSLESKPTKVSIKEGRIRLLSETSVGTVRDNLPLTGNHPDVEASITANLMLRSIGVCTEMAVLEGCTVYRKGDDLFQIVSNLGGQ